MDLGVLYCNASAGKASYELLGRREKMRCICRGRSVPVMSKLEISKAVKECLGYKFCLPFDLVINSDTHVYKETRNA